MRIFTSALAVVACLGFQQGSLAEFRPWSDVRGNAIEAEYVRTAGETVVLRKRDGSEIKVPLSSLSEEDRSYAMLQNPPGIEIKVDDRVDREILGYTRGGGGSGKRELQSIMVEVSLRKTSSEKYDPELVMELFLIGRTKQLNRYVIVEKAESTFSFSDKNKGLHTYSCGPVDIRSMAGNRRAGSEYDGYLAVVRDRRKEIVATKASRLEYIKNADIILGASKGGLFDEDFNLVRTEGDQPAE
jgi:hypothetical protein